MITALHIVAALVATFAVALSAFVVRRETGSSIMVLLGLHLAVAALPALALMATGGGPDEALFFGAIASICMAIAWVDARKLIIPDALVAGLGVVALLAPFCPPVLTQVVGATAMGGLFVGVRQLHFALRRVEGLGLGDVKLAIVLGAMLGANMALLATGIAAACMAVWLAANRPARTPKADGPHKTEAPFGVGLAGALVSACAILAAPR